MRLLRIFSSSCLLFADFAEDFFVGGDASSQRPPGLGLFEARKRVSTVRTLTLYLARQRPGLMKAISAMLIRASNLACISYERTLTYLAVFESLCFRPCREERELGVQSRSSAWRLPDAVRIPRKVKGHITHIAQRESQSVVSCRLVWRGIPRQAYPAGGPHLLFHP